MECVEWNDTMTRAAPVPRRFVAHYRVSTTEQGRSGLGLQARREAVARLAEAHGATIVTERTEVETGKGHDA